MPDTPLPPSPRRPLLWRVIFGLSLAMNVLVICALAGLFLAHDRTRDRPPPPMRSGWVGPLLGSLPPGDRRAVFDDVRRLGEARGISRAGQSEIRSRIIALLEAEPFDPAAFRALLDETEARFGSFALEAQEVLTDRIARMAPAERQDYADRLRRFDSLRGARDKHDDGKPGKDGHDKDGHDKDERRPG